MRIRWHHLAATLALLPALLPVAAAAAGQPIPAEILRVFGNPKYKHAVWGMRVVDLDSGKLLYDLHSDRPFLVGSVRKLYSMGVALNTLGPDHVFHTPVYRLGKVSASGTLDGDLVLVAGGDLAMGGRTRRNGSYAFTNYDHNEANALGNAVLTGTDPLAGYRALARQVAAAGIRRVAGDVVIDDRLFEPFLFRDEFMVRPIFVNDDVVDVSIDRNMAGRAPGAGWRPRSAAFGVRANVVTGAAASPLSLELEPELPACIGMPGCMGSVKGSLPARFVPPLTGKYPLVRTFRIVQPANYARTVFIEALKAAGVAVDAPLAAPNPVARLPKRRDYPASSRVAQLVSHRYRDYVKHILKVSYNIGADTSLVLFGVAGGAGTMAGALAAEQRTLRSDFGIDAGQLHFIDGSGGGETTATNEATIRLLRGMSRRPVFPVYMDALPRLGMDGSLSFVTDFARDRKLAGARGRVHAKTGTFVQGTAQGPVLRTQALAGYIRARSGRRLAFTIAVNDVGVIAGLEDVMAVFQDEGTVAAMLWRAQ